MSELDRFRLFQLGVLLVCRSWLEFQHPTQHPISIHFWMVGACQVWGMNWSDLYGKWGPCKSAPRSKSSGVKFWDRPKKCCSCFLPRHNFWYPHQLHIFVCSPFAMDHGWHSQPYQVQPRPRISGSPCFYDFFLRCTAISTWALQGKWSNSTMRHNSWLFKSTWHGMVGWWDGKGGHEGKISDQLHQQREGTPIKIQVSVLVLNFGWF